MKLNLKCKILSAFIFVVLIYNLLCPSLLAFNPGSIYTAENSTINVEDLERKRRDIDNWLKGNPGWSTHDNLELALQHGHWHIAYAMLTHPEASRNLLLHVPFQSGGRQLTVISAVCSGWRNSASDGVRTKIADLVYNAVSQTPSLDHDGKKSCLDAKNTPSGQTALHIVVQNNDLEMVTWLINHGASVNELDTSGHTPLDYVSKGSSLKIRELLVKHGAVISIPRHNPSCCVML